MSKDSIEDIVARCMNLASEEAERSGVDPADIVRELAQNYMDVATLNALEEGADSEDFFEEIEAKALNYANTASGRNHTNCDVGSAAGYIIGMASQRRVKGNLCSYCFPMELAKAFTLFAAIDLREDNALDIDVLMAELRNNLITHLALNVTESERRMMN